MEDKTPLPHRVVFYYHPIFLEHLAGIQHPEQPQRLRQIVDYLQKHHLWEKMEIKEPQPADEKWIHSNHSLEYMESVKRACQRAPMLLDGGDTYVTERSYEAALYAAGAGMQGVDDLMNDHADAVFCAVRPPGHHAEYDQAMGFCLFNNIAIAARYAHERYHLHRIFILDWDVHHGNGTQNSFYHSSEFYFCSLHEWPLYPGTGRSGEIGRGAGEGYTLNFPLTAGCGDKEYLEIMEQKIIPAIRHYKPDLLLISAGFDAHMDDPLAGMELSTEAYRKMTEMLKEVMETINGGKILSMLEGGYHLSHLSESVAAHLEALGGIVREK
ncbi:MAG: histone deacetylase [Calditrichaeota bacterium]|nr:MAG: histone deacetylase [Calditrichota bacterium]